ncbi:MAG: YdiU family protein [Pseudomonadales bacterium]|nr:YdiU family protein [Pseudomonadales bacterium]
MQTVLTFDNQFTNTLPADPSDENTRRQLKDALYARVSPTPVVAPYLVAHAAEVAKLIGLTDDDAASPEFLQVFSGNHQLTGMEPHATCYGGHQFGNWAGQLGDGRAINLGEVVTEAGHWMLQLKGAGPTPFSRTADGLAVMRSSVREFLCSEAMYHLGVPTTRALSLMGTGENVVRDMLYDGHPAEEPGAVVCRVSSSFVRFGHFQLLAARQETKILRDFTDFVIQREFPHLLSSKEISTTTYVNFFREVCERTADLMVHWMRVGFVHGVMNTDNMSILGETIDYGPYGWLEDFDPDWTPNTTDAAQRRYRYGQQPAIGQWNLMQLANGLLPLIEETKPLEEALGHYAKRYEQGWEQMMADKLGLPQFDQLLTDQLLALLTSAETDMTIFYRKLASLNLDSESRYEGLQDAFYVTDQLTTEHQAQTEAWLDAYQNQILVQSPNNRAAVMNAVNPKYVLRNYIAQLAIDDAENGDFSKVQELLQILRQPYAEQPEYEHYAEKRPEWARTRVGCSMLSCSS